MKAATTLERDETYAVLTQALREMHGRDAQLEAWTSDAQFTEHGKRRVVRYDLEVRVAGLPQPQRYSWVGKYYEDKEKALLVASVLRVIGGSDAARAAGLVVPTVLPYHPPSHLLFLTYESGESVATAISRETGTILLTMGRALAALHGMRITPPTTTSPETVLLDLRPKIEELSSWLPAEESRLRRAFARLENQAPRLPSRISFVHNDFGPANLLWRAGELVVLDFDRCTLGDPALDLGNFLVQLYRSSIRHPERLVDFRLARRALLEEYARWCSPDPGLEDRVAWYERAVLLRKIHRFWDKTKNPGPEDARQIAFRQRLLRVFLEDSAQQGENHLESESVGARSALTDVASFPEDPDVPQLSAAADRLFMLETFRSHLKAVPGKDFLIEDCVPFRFRCRQHGSRHVLQYNLRVTEPTTGRRWDQWVTGLLYVDREKASRRLENMKAQVHDMKIPQSSLKFDPIAFIPSLHMVVEVFPYDRKLRSLGRVVGGMFEGLDALLLGRLDLGDWSVEERTIEPTRYRTEFGATFRYVIRVHDSISERSQDVRCYLKVYGTRNEGGAETFRILESLSEIRQGGEAGYSVVKPISYLSELCTVAIEEAPGISLTQVLLTKQDPSDELKQVARAVASFNQDTLPLTRRHSLADQLATVEKASALVKWACPQLRDKVQGIYDAVAEGMEEGGPAPMHGDLKQDHIFLSDGRVTFIDLDRAALADPLLDPAQLFAYIKGSVGLDSISTGRTEAAAAALVEEYFRHVPESWKRFFPLHCAAALVEVAASIFRRQESFWPEKIARVISAAQQETSKGSR